MTTSEETIRETWLFLERHGWNLEEDDCICGQMGSECMDEHLARVLADAGLLRQEMTEQKLGEWKQGGKRFEMVRLVTAVETREVPDE